MFCEKCGSVLVVREKDGKKFFYCKSCGSTFDITSELKIRSKFKEEERIIEFTESLGEKTSATCPKCGNNEAYFWVQQTRAADEPPTRFYRCTKCNYTWREYA